MTPAAVTSKSPVFPTAPVTLAEGTALRISAARLSYLGAYPHPPLNRERTGDNRYVMNGLQLNCWKINIKPMLII